MSKQTGHRGLAEQNVKSPTATRTLQRGIEVLETLAVHAGDGPLALWEIAALVELDKATTSRLLQTLILLGYAAQDQATRMFRLTNKILSIGEAYRSSLDLPRQAMPFLTELRDRTSETVHLGVLEGASVVYIAKLESPQPVQIASAIGQRMPVHTTALGKAILAALPQGPRRSLMERLDFLPRTARSLTSIEALTHDVQVTMDRGYSVDDRENEDAITCTGAAVLDHHNAVVGALSVSGPTYRVEDRVAAIGEATREIAERFGATL